jgi:CHAT domain-containing protein/tetratricopeptide (TPR) repeat protein
VLAVKRWQDVLPQTRRLLRRQPSPKDKQDDGPEETTAFLGWTPVRQVPAVFAASVADAERATVRWYQDREIAALDERVERWAWICNHPQFSTADLTFRLDALNRFGIAYLDRGVQRHDEPDLKRAEACWLQTLSLAPEGWPDSSRYRHNLGALALNRFWRTGSSAPLEEAIGWLAQATTTAAPTEHLKVIYHDTLGIALSQRYERNGTLDDLEDAIAHGEIALELSSPGSPRRSMYLSNLGSRLRQRFVRTGAAPDIEQSVSLLEAAAQESPTPHETPMILTNLGNSRLSRFDRFGDHEDLDSAIAAQRRAVELTTSDDPLLASRLNNLGNSLRQLYQLHRRLRDLEEAIANYRRAVELTTTTDDDLASRLYNLANSLRDRLELTGNHEDLDEAVRRYRQACATGLDFALEWALGAARVWGAWAEERTAWEEASEAYRYSLRATDRLYRTQLLTEHKQTWLGDSRELAGRASYVLSKLGKLTDAVEALEQNRTRALGEALQFEEAATASIEDSDRAALLRARERIEDLEAAHGANPTTPRDALSASAELREAHGQLATVVDRIRAHEPRFAPEGLRFADIQDLATASHQPIVYLVTTLHGSLALVVPPGGADRAPGTPVVDAIWLDDFTSESLEELLYSENDSGNYLHGTVLGDVEMLSRVLDDVCPFLAEHLMFPIAARLKQLGADQAALIATGVLALLPLHAVTLDEMVFAYAPSARALRSAFHDAGLDSRLATLLAIGNPASAGWPPLAFARQEVEHIVGLCKERALACSALYDEEADLAAVTEHLNEASILHLACHGVFDVDEPLESSLMLAGSDRLSLRGVLDEGLDLSSVRLAVLSACQTAIIDFRAVPDEAIGFPAGFIQAGVPGLVSTLWPVDDASTTALLARFYHHLVVDGVDPGRALNQAQRWLRDSTARDLGLASLWQRTYRESGRRDGDAYRRWSYYRAHPDDRPFSHPFFWAAFAFSGA